MSRDTHTIEYSDKNVGENPIPAWPSEADDVSLDVSWGADEIVEEIEKCRGCGPHTDNGGLCLRHRGMVEGYDEARSDLFREMREADVLDAFNDAIRTGEGDL